MLVKSLADDIRGSLRTGFQITSVPQCINELVLNSLDAYSTNIAVRVNLLTFRLQVVDNGEGISNQNMVLIGDRYMTNRCHTLTDYKKNTRFYGYRGETLASIRDCSKTLTICSCVKDGQTYSITFTKETTSQIIQVQDRITPGTTVTIEDFMYNLPVRKGRVNDNFDLGEIRRNLECLALIHPKVSFSLRNDVNKKLMYANRRAETVEEALINLLPKVKSELLGQIKLTKDNIKISALIYKDNWENSRGRFIFANKRPISCPEVQRKFEEILNAVPIYQNKKPNFLYVLNIRCPQYYLDLCYQGGKTTATFKDFNFIVKCIGKILKKFFEEENICLGTNDKETCVKLTKEVDNNYRLGMMDGAFMSNGAKKKDVGLERRRKDSFDQNTYNILNRSKNQNATKIEQKLKTFDIDNIDNNIDIETNVKKIYSNQISSKSSLQFEDLIQNRLSEDIEQIDKQSDLLNEKIQSNDSIFDRSYIIGSNMNSSNHNQLFEDNLTQLDQQFLIGNRSSIAEFDNFTLSNDYQVKNNKFNCFEKEHNNFHLTENNCYLRKHACKVDDNNFNFNDCYNREDDGIVDKKNNEFNFNLKDFKHKDHFRPKIRGFNENFQMEDEMFNPKFYENNMNNLTFCNETHINHDNSKKFKRAYNENYVLNNNREEINDFGINDCFRKSENYMRNNDYLEHKTGHRVHNSGLRYRNVVDDGFEIPDAENDFDLNVNTLGLCQPDNFTIVNHDGILKPNFVNKRHENMVNWQGNPSFGRTKDFAFNNNIEKQCFICPNLIENKKRHQNIVPNIRINEVGNLTVIVDEKPKQNRFLLDMKRKRKREETVIRPTNFRVHDYGNITFMPNEEPQVVNNDDDFEDEKRGKAIIMDKFINSHFLAEPPKCKKRKKRISNMNFSICTIKTRTIICDENFEFEKNELTFNVNCRFNNLKELEQNSKKNEMFKLKKMFNIPDVKTRRYDIRRTYFGKTGDINNGIKRKEKLDTTEKIKFKQQMFPYKQVKNDTNNHKNKHVRLENENFSKLNQENNYQNVKSSLENVSNSFRYEKNEKQTNNFSGQKHLTCDIKMCNNKNILKNVSKRDNLEDLEVCPEFCDFITQPDTYGKKIKVLSNILIKHVNSSQLNTPIPSMKNNVEKNGLIVTEVKTNLNCSTASKFFADIKFASSPLESNNRTYTMLKNETVIDILNKSGKVSEMNVDSNKNNVFGEKRNIQKSESFVGSLKDNLEIVESKCNNPKISTNNSSEVNEMSADLCALLTETFYENWVTYDDVANSKKNAAGEEQIGMSSINVSFLIQETEKGETNAKIQDAEEDSDLVFTLSQNGKAARATKTDFHGILLSEERDDLIQKSQLNALDETWEKLAIKDNNVFYFNKKTGFSSTINPKNSNEFHIKKRSNLLPKGFSPMSKSLHLIDELLSLTSKQNLHEEIIKSYEDELSMIKWSNLIDPKNPKEFFKNIYRERSKRLSEMEPIMTNQTNFNSIQFSKDIFTNLTVLAQFDFKFIVALEKKRHLIILFDQHAVHERVRVEKLYAEYGIFDSKYKSTSLKQPLVISIKDCNLIIIKEYISKFEALGLKFDIESDAISINQVPTCLYNKANKKIPNNCLDKLLDCLIDEELCVLKDTKNMTYIPKVIQTVINSEACRGSIMFGDKLEKHECVKLLDDLSKCNLPFQCAHGRPTLTPIIELKNIAKIPTKKVNLKNLKQN